VAVARDGRVEQTDRFAGLVTAAAGEVLVIAGVAHSTDEVRVDQTEEAAGAVQYLLFVGG